MTPLRQRMVNDMTVRGLAENTKKSYLNSVSGLACHYGRSPDLISAQEVQDYLLFLHEERGLTWQSCNCARHGIRFLYRITLGIPDPHFHVPGARTPSKLPELMTVEHRAAPGLADIPIELADVGHGAALRLYQPADIPPERETPRQRIMQILADAGTPLSQTQIRQRAAARNATVSTTLHTLMADGRIERTSGSCWRLVNDDA